MGITDWIKALFWLFWMPFLAAAFLAIYLLMFAEGG